jgi:Ca2+-binding EF-hand superfamily protein
MNRRNLLTAFITVTAVWAAKSFAQTTTASPKSPNKPAIATENAKQIMLLMDTDKDGRISKQEWMNFMSKEFDRLDTDHNGYIDQKDLMVTQVYVRHPNSEVTGK